MSKNQQIVRKILGFVALILAGFGIYYNSHTGYIALTGGFGGEGPGATEDFFYVAFAVMSLVCVVCYILLCCFGVKLIRGISFNRVCFRELMIFEVVYFFTVSGLWLVPRIGSSIAAASGVANGGMIAQFLILFPVVGPITLWLTERESQTEIVAEQDVSAKSDRAGE